ncbi:PAS domain-containing sensor histidine kinase [Rhodothermus bifroesti]|uniref:PAS domain-containing sensor histidine kinase n=1 Tax=Rhodothermus bifroesti TaxID=2823335 RepID=UPI001AEF5EB6|nr:PAS domain-containing sensor histidine kinase [Rhodothermus bifroesti]
MMGAASCLSAQTDFGAFLQQIGVLFEVPYVVFRAGDSVQCYAASEALPVSTEGLEAQVREHRALLVLGPKALTSWRPLHFYAGVPAGDKGVLAVADVQPRRFDQKARHLLEALGALLGVWEKHAGQKQRYARLLRGKARLLEYIATGKPLHEVLDAIARWVEAESSGVLVSIVLVREGKRYCGAAPSLPLAYGQAIDAQATGSNVGSRGAATDTCAPVMGEELTADPAWALDQELAHGLRACWSMPILAPDQSVLGTFTLYGCKPGPLEPQDQELAVLATRLTAIALERERQQQALQTREHQLEAVLEQAADAIMLLDRERHVLLFNRAAERLFGYTAPAILGKPIDVLLPGLAEGLGAAATPMQTEAVRSSGERFPVELSCTVIGQPFEMYLLIVRDLTDRLRYEAELVRAREAAEAMSRLKSVLLTNLSHEIRTPLTTVIGFADLLVEEAKAGSPFQEFARLIAEGGRRLLHTLSEVLDLAQLEAQEIVVRPHQLRLLPHLQPLLATYRARAKQKGLKLRLQGTPHLEAWADPVLLERVLEELLDNAVKFTTAGSISVSVQQVGNRIALIVEDTGIGMSAETLQRAFDEFWQASSGMNRTHEGLGLGLTIARRFVGLMGGTIEVWSAPGKGTRFTVWLPARPVVTAGQVA